MNYTYAFILGHIPELSRAEIIKVLASLKVDFKELVFSSQVLVVETAQVLDSPVIQERLGGTIKIACIMYHVSCITYHELFNNVWELIQQRSKKSQGKFKFGFSLYGDINQKEFNKLGLEIKKKLKAENIGCRYVVSKERSLSSVIVSKEKLLEQGMDVVMIKSNQEIYLGYTTAVQDFEDFSHRDFGRPNRDARSGMLPPKLAKMMINLSQTETGGVILDPFCGSGTIIQEALLLGYSKIIGTDVAEKAVLDSQNNLNWLKAKYHLNVNQVVIKKVDVRRLSGSVAAQSVNAIVTEPYLGPSRKNSNFQIPISKKIPNFKFQKSNIVDQLSDLYLAAFKEFYKVLKPGGKVVIILPIVEGQPINILANIIRQGFKQEKLSQTERGSIVYGREGQRVEREIFIFQKYP